MARKNLGVVLIITIALALIALVIFLTNEKVKSIEKSPTHLQTQTP